MSTISVVVTAPHGIADCVHIGELLSEADGRGVEVVVVDGSGEYADQSRPGLRHVAAQDGCVQGLISAGIRCATLDWVVVTEDHCRILPGLLDAYRAAIQDSPDVDLFSGSVENLTSTSPWSTALFLAGGLAGFQRSAMRTPTFATNANLMVRRSAVLESELAVPGGMLNLCVPRIVKSGRYRHCPAAAVDHILEMNGSRAVLHQFSCAQGVVERQRAILPEASVSARITRDVRALAYLAAYMPWRVAMPERGTLRSGLGMALRLTLLGLAIGVATLLVDIKLALRGKRSMRYAAQSGSAAP